MKTLARRYSFVEDCLLAGFASAIAYVIILPFASIFSWSALLALLIVPTASLSTYRRYRAAGASACFALVAGAWQVVPPSGSFAMNETGIAAVVTLAAVSMMTIAAAARVAKRRIATHASQSRA